MEQINGITFEPFARKGVFADPGAMESLRMMKERTEATHVIFAPAGLQETPQSEEIDYRGDRSLGDEELSNMISFAHAIGLKVILKPTVNCKNGVWRAFINFFDNEVPCEPKWRNWFASHEQFQLHYARLAQKTGCCMFITGCEMVMAQRRDAEWRELIAKVREVFDGPVSYNTDKYQEEHVSWWDCVDVISSSGYYPFGSWEHELDRIEGVVKRFEKPFFFAETGCMSVKGSGQVPNDWELSGEADENEQAAWYEEMFSHTKQRSWVGGYGLWDWPADLRLTTEKGYSFYNKRAEAVIRSSYEKTEIE
ncbi:MAG: 1,4-beta-xylanase [Oscillospiraceae bacterium]|nr:1,4-beta-xylanase [Oscillospiraceae bacterium]